MSWSIDQVARLSGLTSRTLRHYDAIGLLPPAWTGEGGRRHYEYEDLLRLHQIMTLRELAVGLAEIGELLDRGGPGEAARVSLLNDHLRRLRDERARLDRLIVSVEEITERIEGGDPMAADHMFEAFRENPYEEEARQRWGDDAVEASMRRAERLSPEQARRVTEGFDDVHARIAAAHEAGLDPAGDEAQAIVADHYALISVFWEPSPDAYRNLVQMYVDDDRFRESIGRGNDEMVEYLRRAATIYAQRRADRGAA